MIAKHLDKTKELIKYFIASIISLAVDTAVYLALGKALHNYLVSACIGYTIGLVVNYILSIKWVFSYRKIKKYHIEFGVFAVIGFLGLAVNEAAIYIGLFVMALNPFWSKMMAAGLSFLCNFGARKLLLYTKWSSGEKVV